jgi:hypothetical protein
MEKLLKDLGITKVGSYSKDGSYVIDLDSSDEFGKIYSLLENSEDLHYMEENNLLTISNASMTYRYGEEYQLQLIADFNYDLYKLVVNEI